MPQWPVIGGGASVAAFGCFGLLEGCWEAGRLLLGGREPAGRLLGDCWEAAGRLGRASGEAVADIKIYIQNVIFLPEACRVLLGGACGGSGCGDSNIVSMCDFSSRGLSGALGRASGGSGCGDSGNVELATAPPFWSSWVRKV